MIKNVKNELILVLTSPLICTDCNGMIYVGEKYVRIYLLSNAATLMRLHEACAKDLGGDLAIEMAR